MSEGIDYFTTEAWSGSKSVEQQRTLSRAEVLDLAGKVFEFCLASTGVELRPYQKEFGLRMVQSVLLGDGEEITALFARQGGKTETVACTVVGMMVILPFLANMVDEAGARLGPATDDRIYKFRDGFWVGIFAPVYHQSGIMHARMAQRINSKSMRAVLEEPELGFDEIPEGRKSLTLPNGSYVDCSSAAPGVHIEGKTLHFIICEECQDISNYKIKKSIHPMGAETLATIVKIGTPNPHRNDFYDACERNRRNDLERGPGELPQHFQYDYRYPSKWSPNYRAYVEKEMERSGYDSDEFKMAYRLIWMLDRGHFVVPEIMEEAGVRHRDELRVMDGSRIVHRFVRPDYPTTHDWTSPGLVAAIDYGKTQDPTVITVAKVWWDNPTYVAENQPRYPTHVLNWLELYGDDHEAQQPEILGFLGNYKLEMVVADATGKGDPLTERLGYDLRKIAKEKSPRDPSPPIVVPFVFSTQSKHEAYTCVREELSSGRLSYVAGKGARKQRKWREFVKQMTDLQKEWKGRYLSVHAPTSTARGDGKKKLGHDDYPDSLAMLVWGVNIRGQAEAEQQMANPFYGPEAAYARARRRGQNAMMRRDRMRTRRRG